MVAGRRVRMIFRSYREGDEKEIINLLSKVFNGWHHKKYWFWKFESQSFFNRKTIIWVAEENNEIVGHLAAIPSEMKIGDSSFPVAQIVDGATHPKHRRKGIFKTLIDKVSTDAKKEGFYAIYGFSNVPAFEVFKKKLPWLNFCEITQMFKITNLASMSRKLRIESDNNSQRVLTTQVSRSDQMKIPNATALMNLTKTLLNTAATLAKLKRHIKDPNIKIIKSNLIEEKTESLWQKSSGNYNIAMEKKTKNLNWRYQNPEAQYTILSAHSVNNGQLDGYSVTTTEHTNLKVGPLKFANLKIGHIMDILAKDERIFRLILSHSEQHLLEHDVDLIHCWAIRNGPNYHLYREMGFCPFPENLGKITFWLHAFKKVKSDDILWNPRKILISLGDSDLY